MSAAQPAVLIVEDDVFMQGLLAKEFAKAGFRVVLAGDGAEAVERFADSRPDVVLLDILMPQKNGLEALREIRALPGGAGVPTLILSNFEETSYLREAEELGVKAYLIKANMQLPEIVSKVREALR